LGRKGNKSESKRKSSRNTHISTGRKLFPVSPPEQPPLYEALHTTPFLPLKRSMELRILQSVDAIMAQVRQELLKLDEESLDLVGIEILIRNVCLRAAAVSARNTRWGEDLKKIDEFGEQCARDMAAAVGLARQKKRVIAVLCAKALQESIYFRKSRPHLIRLGTHWKEDITEYREIGLT
jgi:hypothetical protein